MIIFLNLPLTHIHKYAIIYLTNKIDIEVLTERFNKKIKRTFCSVRFFIDKFF